MAETGEAREGAKEGEEVEVGEEGNGESFESGHGTEK